LSAVRERLILGAVEPSGLSSVLDGEIEGELGLGGIGVR
jgi:hypothetical protein